MATLLNQRVPAGSLVVGRAEATFIMDAAATVVGDIASDLRNAMAILLGITEANALRISIQDMYKRYTLANFPTSP